jgi:hypothetical protein
MKKFYGKNKQIEYAEKYKSGDVEVSICPECISYFKQPTMPRVRCHPCHIKQDIEDKIPHNSMSRKLQYWKKSQTGRERIRDYRQKMMPQIRKMVSVDPPVNFKDPTYNFKRICLRCPKQFNTDCKFTRLCDGCHDYANTNGMSEYTHYFVTD